MYLKTTFMTVADSTLTPLSWLKNCSLIRSSVSYPANKEISNQPLPGFFDSPWLSARLTSPATPHALSLQVLYGLAAGDTALALTNLDILGDCSIHRLLIFGQARQPTGQDAAED